MPQFRKKPVVIEAFQWYGGMSDTLPRWFLSAVEHGEVWLQGGESPYVTIKTLEGDHRANIDDWIIQGVKGELYPCKPDIFAATYEPA